MQSGVSCLSSCNRAKAWLVSYIRIIIVSIFKLPYSVSHYVLLPSLTSKYTLALHVDSCVWGIQIMASQYATSTKYT